MSLILSRYLFVLLASSSFLARGATVEIPVAHLTIDGQEVKAEGAKLTLQPDDLATVSWHGKGEDGNIQLSQDESIHLLNQIYSEPGAIWRIPSGGLANDEVGQFLLSQGIDVKVRPDRRLQDISVPTSVKRVSKPEKGKPSLVDDGMVHVSLRSPIKPTALANDLPEGVRSTDYDRIAEVIDQEKKVKEPVSIRWMIRRDMPEVLDIERRSFRGAAWSEKDFMRTLSQRTAIGMVAESDDQVVGFMVYELGKKEINLLDIAVDPDFRKKGVGTALVNKIKRKLGPKRPSLIVSLPEEKVQASPFFEKAGFKAEDPEPAHLGQKVLRFNPFLDSEPVHETEPNRMAKIEGLAPERIESKEPAPDPNHLSKQSPSPTESEETFRLREATMEDFDRINAIGGDLTKTSKQRRRLLKLAMLSKIQALVLVGRKGQVAGFIFYDVDSSKRKARILDMAIDQKYQSRGLGRRLVRTLSNALGTAFDEIQVLVPSSVPSSGQFFEKLGFEFYQTIPDTSNSKTHESALYVLHGSKWKPDDSPLRRETQVWKRQTPEGHSWNIEFVPDTVIVADEGGPLKVFSLNGEPDHQAKLKDLKAFVDLSQSREPIPYEQFAQAAKGFQFHELEHLSAIFHSVSQNKTATLAPNIWESFWRHRDENACDGSLKKLLPR